MENDQYKMTQEVKMGFSYLPGYAQYLKDHYLHEYILEHLKLSGKMNPAMRRYFEAFTEEELVEMSARTMTRFLDALVRNETDDMLEHSLRIWMENLMPGLKRNQVVSVNVIQASYIRKYAFMKFLPGYTNDPKTTAALVSEFDRLNLAADTAALESYEAIVKEYHSVH